MLRLKSSDQGFQAAFQRLVRDRRESDDDVAASFLDEIAGVLERVLAQPSQFPDVHRGVRRALLKHFPYAIYFRTHRDIATIVAVVHQRQAPNRWKIRS